jgi:DNA-binding CsgD family transcriptional regulator
MGRVDEADARLVRINSGDGFQALAEAFAAGDHQAYGLAWTDYLDTKCSSRPRPGHADQEQVIKMMTAAGMTQREVSAATDLSHQTVGRVLFAGGPYGPPAKRRPARGAVRDERAARVWELKADGLSDKEIADHMDMSLSSVNEDIKRHRTRLGAEEQKHPQPTGKDYIDNVLVRSILADAQRTKEDDWVVRVATLAARADTAGDTKWAIDLRAAVKRLWISYGRILQVLDSKVERDRVIASPEERDSSYRNDPAREERLLHSVEQMEAG